MRAHRGALHELSEMLFFNDLHHAEMFTGLCLSSILQCEGTAKAEHTGLHKMCVHTHILIHNTLHTQPHAQSNRLVVLQPLNC